MAQKPILIGPTRKMLTPGATSIETEMMVASGTLLGLWEKLKTEIDAAAFRAAAEKASTWYPEGHVSRRRYESMMRMADALDVFNRSMTAARTVQSPEGL